jgi:hypothetical protein
MHEYIASEMLPQRGAIALNKQVQAAAPARDGSGGVG